MKRYSAYEETVFQGFIGSNALNCMIIAYNYHGSVK